MKQFTPILFICLLITFKVTAQVPAISSFSPIKGKPGTTVTISGSNFNATDTSNVVYFGAVKATITNASASSLTVTVPTGATYGPITVFNKSTKLAAMSNAFFTPTFYPSKGAITTSDLTARVDMTTAVDYPYRIAIGDLDGDGKPDLAVPIAGTNYISVYRNIGNSGSLSSSSFAAAVNITVGAGPGCAVIADFDGDGKPDVASANANISSVSVARNTSTVGTISFNSRVDFSIGSSSFGLAVGDLDGDGKLDIAVVNSTSTNTVSVFRNTSTSGSITSSSFATRVNFATGSSPFYVAIGDLDGDGKPDLAVANGASNTVSLLRNTSTSGSITTSSFAAKVDIATGAKPVWVSMGDLDGDGKFDLTTANNTANAISVFRNTSTSGSITTSSFAAKVDFATGTWPGSVEMGDIDGDGKLDLVAANASSNTISIYHNNISSSGNITSSSFATKVDFASGVTAAIVSLGDLDGDGRTDIVTANSSFKTFSLFRNNPQYPAPIISSLSDSTATAGSSITINGSNFSVVATDNVVFVGAAQAEVTAASATALTITIPVGATYGPIKVTDISTGLTGISSAYFTPIFSPAKGSLNSNDIAAKVDFATATNPYAAVISDIDGDEKPDLIIANNGSNSVSVFRNTSSTGSIGAFSFAGKVDFTTGTNPSAVAMGDIDGDGKPDIVVTNSGSNSISVFRNMSSSGNIAFAAKVDFATGTNPVSVALGDFEGNGKLDIVVANYGSNTISVFRNTTIFGSGITTSSFAAKADVATGTNPDFAVISDLDGDGKADVAVTNYTASTVSLFRNTSTSSAISFAAKVDFATGTNPRSIAMGDLDGDGKKDLAVANYTASTISLFRNISTSGSITTSSFSAKVDFTTGTNPYSIAMGDLDGDGKADVTTANSGSNNISIFRNTATSGSFSTSSLAAKVDFATSTSPYTIAIGDLDNDGKADLVTANKTANTLSVLRNNPQYSPVINSFTPASAGSGALVTINGHYFTGSSAVSLGGVAVSGFTVVNDSTITVTVGNGATGNVSVTNIGGTTTKAGFIYCVPTGSTTIQSACNSYIWNGVTYTSSGSYTYTTTNNVGCDSTATLNLTIKNSSLSTTNINICSTQFPYSWNGNAYNAGGTYTAHLLNALGCDSAATLHLGVKNNYTITAIPSSNVNIFPGGNTTVCDGGTQTYTFNPASGYYVSSVIVDGVDMGAMTSFTFTSVSSNHTITANFSSSCVPNSSTNNISLCSNQLPYNWNGNNYTSTGSDTVHLTNSGGCDSAAILNLIVKQISASTTTHIACSSYTWNNSTYTVGGTYTYATSNSVGCDSIATLNLTINQPTSSTASINVCSNQLPYMWNGLAFTGAGTQSITLTNSKGCDSIATLTVTVGSAVTPGVSITGPSNVCDNASITYTANVINGGSSPIYQWKQNGNDVGAGSSITFAAGTMASGDVISCMLSANNACQTMAIANSNSIAVTVKQSPVIGISTITSSIMCTINGTNNVYNSNTLYGGTWSSSNTSVVTVSTMTGSSGIVTAVSNGIATLTYTKSSNGCSSTASVNVTVAAVPATNSISGPANLCMGSSVQLSTTANGGSWSSANNNATVNATGLVIATGAGNAIIQYTVSNAYGCSSSGVKNIAIAAKPAVPAITYATGSINPQTSGGNNYCNNKTFTLQGTPGGGSWSSTGGVTIHPVSGVASTIALGVASVMYTVTNNGCSNSRIISGTVMACASRSVNTNVLTSNDASFTLYPNPAKSFISLNVHSLIGSGSIVIVDLYGKQVKQQPLGIGINTVDISGLSKGMYLVNVVTNDGKKTEKLIIE